MDGRIRLLLGRHEEIRRVDLIFLKLPDARHRDGIHLFDAVDFIVPEGDAQEVVGVGQEDIHGVALDPIFSSREADIVARVKRVIEATQKGVAVDDLPPMQLDDILVEGSRVSHAVNT